MAHVINLFMRVRPCPAMSGPGRGDPIWSFLLGGDPLGEGYRWVAPNNKYQMGSHAEKQFHRSPRV